MVKRIIWAWVLFQAAPGLFAQAPSGQGGTFSLGVRNTFSFFNGGTPGEVGMGSGGQFRIRLTDQINTEWYADYITGNISGLASRNDAHIGWSVLFYPFKSLTESGRFFQPFAEAGHCFDYTKVKIFSDSTFLNRWSSAVQMGLGTHLNLSPKADITLKSQYMVHLGTDIHVEEDGGHIHLHQHKGNALEGHLLFTASLNIKLFQLW